MAYRVQGKAIDIDKTINKNCKSYRRGTVGLKNKRKRIVRGSVEIRERFNPNELMGYYINNNEFIDIFDSGKYLFVDGFVCVKNPNCFYCDENGLHVKEKLLKDYSSGILIRQSVIREGPRIVKKKFLKPDENKYRELELSWSSGSGNTITNGLIEAGDLEDYIGQGPPPPFNNYAECLSYYMNEDKRKWSIYDMEDLTGISSRSVANYLGDRAYPSLPYAVAICLALMLPYDHSLNMIQLSENVLGNIKKEHRAYHYLLQYHPIPSVIDANSWLEHNKLAKLTNL